MSDKKYLDNIDDMDSGFLREYVQRFKKKHGRSPFTKKDDIKEEQYVSGPDLEEDANGKRED